MSVAPHKTVSSEPYAADVDTPKAAVSRLQSSIFDADLEAAKLDQHVQLKRLQRDELMLALTKAQRTLDQRRSELSEQELQQVQLDTQLHAARKQLSSFQGQIESVETAEVEPSVIKHVATPLAQTVFAREEHFRLLGGRLAYVPLNELAERLKSEAPKKVWKLKEAERTTETIGPRDDFYLKYTLRRGKYVYDTGAGPGVREVVELERFVMIPASDQLGEKVEDALRPGSQLLERLQGWSADETIVTVWTYPDSFEDFRQLKDSLYGLGFLTAARPLPAGQPISGSPQGTRSAAQ